MELKPCPFCGKKPIGEFTFAGKSEATVFYITCLACSSATKCHKTEQEAADAWNTRPQSEEIEDIAKDMEKHNGWFRKHGGHAGSSMMISRRDMADWVDRLRNLSGTATPEG